MPFFVNMPKLSPTMESGTIASWTKKEGDFVEEGEVLLEINTDKATVEHRALDEGYLRKILVQEGEEASVNAPLAIFTAEEKESIEGFEPSKPQTPTPTQKEEKPEAATPQPVATAAPSMAMPLHIPPPPLENYSFPQKPVGRPLASPLAKKLAKEKGLDLGSVAGTGPGGRITSHDLDKALPLGKVTFGQTNQPTEAPGSYEEVKLSPIRKVVAKRLQESKSFIPHFYLKQTVNAQPLIEVREQLKEHNIKVTFNDLLIKACALTLRDHPRVNAGFHSQNQTVIHYKTVDISVAVSLEDGLITPIVRYADYKNVADISMEVKDLIKKAREGHIEEHEYKGGSFCISNLGMFGLSEFTAVINPPQAAILAVGGIEEAAVVKNGQIVAGKQMHLTLSCDHRVVDGADGARFLKDLQHLVENPVALLLS
jgi:pyruvate dehydrogenase E2 component (dihydrolipoamide acetyltransferase)